MGQRSQDLEPLYFENGLLYITRASYIEKGVILAERNLPFVVDSPLATVDIDHQADLEWAEFLLNKQ
jgi:N-acylneuraminate cytidylyltransferase